MQWGGIRYQPPATALELDNDVDNDVADGVVDDVAMVAERVHQALAARSSGRININNDGCNNGCRSSFQWGACLRLAGWLLVTAYLL